MACCRASVEDLGLDLHDGGPALLDFRLQPKMILGNEHVLGTLLGKFVPNLEMGLQNKSFHITSTATPKTTDTQWIDHVKDRLGFDAVVSLQCYSDLQLCH